MIYIVLGSLVVTPIMALIIIYSYEHKLEQLKYRFIFEALRFRGFRGFVSTRKNYALEIDLKPHPLIALLHIMQRG